MNVADVDVDKSEQMSDKGKERFERTRYFCANPAVRMGDLLPVHRGCNLFLLTALSD